MTNLLMAGASRFAHLAGLRFRAGADDTDDDAPKSKGKAADDADADDDGKPADDEPKSKTKAKNAKAADDADADGEPADDESKSKTKAKNAKAADDDADADDKDEDDDDREMSGSGPRAAARRRERARCAAIFAHAAAGGNPALAASLAFDTTLSRSAAIAVMSSQPKATATPVRTARAAGNPVLGADGQPPKAATSWDRSMAKLGITPRR